jgi:curved DNA-binding protein CbpA
VIHAAYRVLARVYHPDVSHDQDAAKAMCQLNAAYEVLSDRRRRAQYDARCARAARVLNGSRAGDPMGRRHAPLRPAALPAEPMLLASLQRALVVVVIMLALSILACLSWFVIDTLEDRPSNTLHAVTRVLADQVP